MPSTSAKPASGDIVTYLNPDSLPKSPVFTQAVAVTAPSTTVYIGMQNAVNAQGEIVGKGDIAAQVTQTLANLEACLEAAGATKADLVLMTIYLVDGQDLQTAFAPYQQWADRTAPPPANTGFYVPRLHDPDLLIGIEAIAVIPAQ